MFNEAEVKRLLDELIMTVEMRMGAAGNLRERLNAAVELKRQEIMTCMSQKAWDAESVKLFEMHGGK